MRLIGLGFGSGAQGTAIQVKLVFAYVVHFCLKTQPYMIVTLKPQLKNCKLNTVNTKLFVLDQKP